MGEALAGNLGGDVGRCAPVDSGVRRWQGEEGESFFVEAGKGKDYLREGA